MTQSSLPGLNIKSRLVLYYSGSLGSKKSLSQFKRLQQYGMASPGPVDFYAEEYPAYNLGRPLWKEILCLISQGQVRELVVPSVSHIANSASALLSFLEFASRYQVRVVSLAQKNKNKEVMVRS